MLCSNILCLQGIGLHGTIFNVNHNADSTSGLCSVSQGFHLLVFFFFFLHQISPSRLSECAQQDIRVLLLIPIAPRGVHKRGRAGTAFKGGFSCFWRHQWLLLKACTFYLAGILCIYRSVPDTIPVISVSQEKLSPIVNHRLQDKKAWPAELWPCVQPTVCRVESIHIWHHRQLIYLSLRLGC